MTDGDRTDGAEIVIIGGGILGCSIAWHLGLAGITDVLVLERNELASGATARAAGLVSHGSADAAMLRLVSRTRAAIGELEQFLDEPLDFRGVGAIQAAFTSEREQELLRVEATMAAEGVEVDLLGPGDARVMRPWLEFGAARRIIHVPRDGHIDGARLAAAYGRAARRMGARIRRGTAVRGLVSKDGVVSGVVTDSGTIRSSVVVDAAGAWSAEVARWLGWGFPAAPTRSHYWITRPDGSGGQHQPNVHLPDMRAYFRSETGGLVVGFQEPRTRTYDPMALPADMADAPLDEGDADTDLLLDHAAGIRGIAPAIDGWEFAHHVTGLSMYTPDGKFVLGKVAGTEGFVVCGGCCGAGIAASGGLGEATADIVLDKGGEWRQFDPNRFGTVDPASDEFRARCAAARAGKSRGRSGETRSDKDRLAG
ncbi:MAG TPA: FAD-binding oxidoreductase [Paracoccaceae bacterium]|nr:FAD-binding oxidoreductase [Paracoccaceae bacterium]